MKKIAIAPSTCIIFIVITTGLNVCCCQSHDIYYYQPRDATLQDNIYNITIYPSFQWYYLDAILSDNYSVHIGMVAIGAKGIFGMFLFRINLYHNGVLLEEKHKFVPLQHLTFSQQDPCITLGETQVFQSSVNAQGQLVTNISLAIDNIQVLLTYTGETQGWIGFTGKGMWGCPLPKAKVHGILIIDHEQIPVQGIGYQEHGWDIQRLHRSWYWGKFSTANTNVVFSHNMKNHWLEDTFIVMINQGEENYTSVPRENVELEHVHYSYSHGRFIPTSSVLTIHYNDIDIEVTIDIEHEHFTTLFFVNHWRFHATITGTVSIGDMVEQVNDFQIIEIFHFP